MQSLALLAAYFASVQAFWYKRPAFPVDATGMDVDLFDSVLVFLHGMLDGNCGAAARLLVDSSDTDFGEPSDCDSGLSSYYGDSIQMWRDLDPMWNKGQDVAAVIQHDDHSIAEQDIYLAGYSNGSHSHRV